MPIIKTLPESLPASAPTDMATIYSVREAGGAEAHEHCDKEGLGLMCRYWCDTPTSDWQLAWSHVAMPGLVMQGKYNEPPVLVNGKHQSSSQRLYAKLVEAFGLASRKAMQSELDKFPQVRAIAPIGSVVGRCVITGLQATHSVHVARCWRSEADAHVRLHESVGLDDHAALLAAVDAAGAL